MSPERDPVRAALQMAIRQNAHDMLMTGEEIRQCELALATSVLSSAGTPQDPSRSVEQAAGSAMPPAPAGDKVPAAWASSDWMRAITETELALIPNVGADKGRRDRCRSMYRIPLYTAAPAAPVAEPEWRPMSTAPQDRPVLVCNPERGGSWIAYYGPIAVSGYRFDDPWRSLMLNCRWHGTPHANFRPTLWREIPLPPHVPTPEVAPK